MLDSIRRIRACGAIRLYSDMYLMMYLGIAPSQLQMITNSPTAGLSGVYSHVRMPICSNPENRGVFSAWLPMQLFMVVQLAITAVVSEYATSLVVG